MTQHRKHRGYSSQRIVADWFTVNGWPYAEPVGAGRAGSDVTEMRTALIITTILVLALLVAVSCAP